MWFATFLCGLYFQYAIFQMTAFNALSNIFISQLGLSTSQFGFISSSYFYTAAASLIPAGFLLDRYNIKRIILLIFLLISCP